MAKNLVLDTGKILLFAEEAQGNDIYMTLKLVLFDNLVNLNKVQYSAEFIKEIAENKEKYMCIPLVAEQNKLDSGKYDNLTHRQNKKTGLFQTQMIGSFIDFEVNEDGEIIELIGTARIPKRFYFTCEALKELYEDGNLKFSYEISVGEYSVKDGVKCVDKSDSNNLIGMCVVSNPAVPKATAIMLSAALESDFNNIEGGDDKKVDKVRDANITVEDMFSATKIHFESAELDLSQIQRKIYNELKSFIGDEWYNYDIKDMTMDYIILTDYYSGDYYRVDYSVQNENVVLSNKRKVTKTYLDIKEEDTMTLAEVQAKLEAAEAKAVVLEKTVAEKDTIIVEKETVIAEKEANIAELNDKINTLSEAVVTKDNEIAELTVAKTELDQIKVDKAEAEKVKKKEALQAKYSKLLDKDILALPEIAEAIETLNESVLQAKVTEIALEKAEKTDNKDEQEKKDVVTASVTDDIAINGNDIVSKYVTVSR